MFFYAIKIFIFWGRGVTFFFLKQNKRVQFFFQSPPAIPTKIQWVIPKPVYVMIYIPVDTILAPTPCSLTFAFSFLLKNLPSELSLPFFLGCLCRESWLELVELRGLGVLCALSSVLKWRHVLTYTGCPMYKQLKVSVAPCMVGQGYTKENIQDVQLQGV